MCVVLATNHAHCSLRVRVATGGPERDGGAVVEIHLGHPLPVHAVGGENDGAHVAEARLEVTADAEARLAAFPVKRVVLADDAVPLEVTRRLELLNDVATDEHAAFASGHHVEESLLSVQITPMIDVIPAIHLSLVYFLMIRRPP